MRRVFRPALVAVALAAAAVTAVVAPARAADMGVPPSYYPPATMPPAVYDWTGIYFGGQVGVGMTNDTFTQATAAPLNALSGPAKVNPLGVLGGAQVGFNYEFMPWVIGAEASWAASGISGAKTVSTTVAGTTERLTSNPLSLISATAHVGVAANDLMVYLKGGGAWINVNYAEEIFIGGVNNNQQTIGDFRSGVTGGVGLEYGLTEHWSARLEYDFYDFGTKTYNFTNTPVSVQSYLNELTLGINYRFSWFDRPIAAR